MGEKTEIAPESESDYISPRDIAKKRGVSLRTVHRWLRLKIIKGEQLAGAKGKWFIPR